MTTPLFGAADTSYAYSRAADELEKQVTDALMPIMRAAVEHGYSPRDVFVCMVSSATLVMSYTVLSRRSAAHRAAPAPGSYRPYARVQTADAARRIINPVVDRPFWERMRDAWRAAAEAHRWARRPEDAAYATRRAEEYAQYLLDYPR